MCSETDGNKASRAALVAALVGTVALVVAGTATAAPAVNVSKTVGLEAGDWILVQVNGFQAKGNITIVIDGVAVFQGKLDNTGSTAQSVQVPYTVRGGYTKLTVTDNVNTLDTNIQIKGSMDSFVETMQSLTPLTKLLVGLAIILLPLLLILGCWHWMKN